jgi:hypothetical protein
MKTCKKCQELKPTDQFHKQPQIKDGRANSCKTCTNEEQRIRKASNPEQQKAQNERRKTRIKDLLTRATEQASPELKTELLDFLKTYRS